MSQSGWLLHSICPCGIACMCVGLSGQANVFSLSMHIMCVCVCLCATIFITGQLHKLKASNQQRRHTVPCEYSPYTVPIPENHTEDRERTKWKFFGLSYGCLQELVREVTASGQTDMKQLLGPICWPARHGISCLLTCMIHMDAWRISSKLSQVY